MSKTEIYSRYTPEGAVAFASKTQVQSRPAVIATLLGFVALGALFNPSSDATTTETNTEIAAPLKVNHQNTPAPL